MFGHHLFPVHYCLQRMEDLRFTEGCLRWRLTGAALYDCPRIR